MTEINRSTKIPRMLPRNTEKCIYCFVQHSLSTHLLKPTLSCALITLTWTSHGSSRTPTAMGQWGSHEINNYIIEWQVVELSRESDMAVWREVDKWRTWRFRNGFKEAGTLVVCLGREVGIGQVEKRNRRQSLKDGWRLGKSSIFPEVRTRWRKVEQWCWRGKQGLCQEGPAICATLKTLNFIPEVKESKGDRVKQCYSKYGPWASTRQQMVCFYSVTSTGIKRMV